MIAMPSLVSAASAAACAAPVCTSAVAGTSGSRDADELVRGGSGFRGDRDRVELPLLLEERLCRRHVEDRERRPSDRVDGAEPRDSRDLVLLDGAERGDPDRVADLVALLARGIRVDDHLVGPLRPCALRRGSAARSEARSGRGPPRTWVRPRSRRSSCHRRRRAVPGSSSTGCRGSHRRPPPPPGAPGSRRGARREPEHGRSRRTSGAASR